MRFTYNLSIVSPNEFKNTYPELSAFIVACCKKHNIKHPAIRIINDRNPVAYTFGSTHRNARLVISTGLFEYLNTREQRAVIAHELGHIVHGDFAIMTIASIMVQTLFFIYFALWSITRGRKESYGNSNKIRKSFIVLAWASYACYIIATYLFLYLSRVREYAADRFAAIETRMPDVLSVALVKLSYGLTQEGQRKIDKQGDDQGVLDGTTNLLSTCDKKDARTKSEVYSKFIKTYSQKYLDDIHKVFLYDLFSPWAKLSELKSAHPLTAKRIMKLSGYSINLYKKTLFDIRKTMGSDFKINRKRMYKGFLSTILIIILPQLTFLIGLTTSLLLYDIQLFFNTLIATAIASIIKGHYKYSRGRDSYPAPKTQLKLMQNPYCNPFKGEYVSIEGKVRGRGNAGSYFDEDIMIEDTSKGLLYLNYSSFFGFLGNLIFGITKVKELVGQQTKAVGWFRRTTTQLLDLDILHSNGKSVTSYTRFWNIFPGYLLLIGTVLFKVLFIDSDILSSIPKDKIPSASESLWFVLELLLDFL